MLVAPQPTAGPVAGIAVKFGADAVVAALGAVAAGNTGIGIGVPARDVAVAFAVVPGVNAPKGRAAAFLDVRAVNGATGADDRVAGIVVKSYIRGLVGAADVFGNSAVRGRFDSAASPPMVAGPPAEPEHTARHGGPGSDIAGGAAQAGAGQPVTDGRALNRGGRVD